MDQWRGDVLMRERERNQWVRTELTSVCSAIVLPAARALHKMSSSTETARPPSAIQPTRRPAVPPMSTVLASTRVSFARSSSGICGGDAQSDGLHHSGGCTLSFCHGSRSRGAPRIGWAG